MTTVVLAMHGAPPKDYPPSDLVEFFKFHMMHEVGGEFPQAMHQKYEVLHTRMREWLRTAENDPFWDASHKLAVALSEVTGHEVVVGFNEFCGPSVSEVLEQAVASGVDDIIVITPMMTPGGEHSEIDIPNAIKQTKERHSHVSIRYAWPFDLTVVAAFLAEQLSNH